MRFPSQALLRNYWCAELGCSAKAFDDHPAINVCAHGTLRGYAGIYLLKHADGYVISCPRSQVADWQGRLGYEELQKLFSTGLVDLISGGRLERIVGPSWIGWVNPTTFKACHGSETRLLSEDDEDLFWRFMEENPEEDRMVSSLRPGRTAAVGVFLQNELVAVAGYSLLAGQIAHVGVMVRPAWRGHGYSRLAVSGITEVALRAELGIQYQTLRSNEASIRSARSLGYELFAETLAARWHEF